MGQRILTSLLGLAWVCGSAQHAQAVPLDLLDVAPRTIVAEFTYGGPQAAQYSVTGGVGEVHLSPESHQQVRPSFIEPVPESFTPLVLHIDLADGSATSELATGGYASPPLSETFVQGPLSTDAVAGFVSGNSLPPLFCTSQQQVNEWCLLVPLFCGAVCNPVAGSAYDPATGVLELVGPEERVGCDGAVCAGPFVYLGTLSPSLSELVPSFVGDTFDWSVSRGTPPPLDFGSTAVIDPGLEDEVLEEEVLGSFDVGPDTVHLTVVLEDGASLASALHWEFSGLDPVGAPEGVQITGLSVLGGTGTVVSTGFGPDSLSIVTAREQAPPNVFTYDLAVEVTYVPEPDGTLFALAALGLLARRRL
jgi:hypothetical protein